MLGMAETLMMHDGNAPNGEAASSTGRRRNSISQMLSGRRLSWRPTSAFMQHLLQWNAEAAQWTDITISCSAHVAGVSLLLGIMGVGGLAKDVVIIISQLDLDVDLLLYSIFLDLLHMTAGMVGMLASVWKSLPTAGLFLMCLVGDAAMLLAGTMFAAQSYRGHPALLAVAFVQIALVMVFLYIGKTFHSALKMEERMRSTPNYNRRAVLTADAARQHARLLQPSPELKEVPPEVIVHLTEQLGVEQDEVLQALSASRNNVEAAAAMLVMLRTKESPTTN